MAMNTTGRDARPVRAHAPPTLVTPYFGSSHTRPGESLLKKRVSHAQHLLLHYESSLVTDLENRSRFPLLQN